MLLMMRTCSTPGIPHVVPRSYLPLPWLSPSALAHEILGMQSCTTPTRGHRSNYVDWLKQERMHLPQWKTFNVSNYEEDAVLLLFVSADRLGRVYGASGWYDGSTA